MLHRGGLHRALYENDKGEPEYVHGGQSCPGTVDLAL